MEQKRCESNIHKHDGDLWVTIVGWMYRIMTEVTPDVGVPSTYLVLYVIHYFHKKRLDVI